MQRDKLTEDLFIYQSDSVFRYGIDAVLLAHFSLAMAGEVIDLGTGTGIIPLLLSSSSRISRITGLEYQSQASDLAKKSIRDNGLEDRVEIIEGDFMEIDRLFARGSFSGVVSNPPYFEKGHGLACKDRARIISRSEEVMDLRGLVEAASYLLKPKSPFYLIYRPRRLVQLLHLLAEYGLEPKTLRFVHPRRGSEANLVLVEAIRSGGRQCRVLDPLFVYEATSYSQEILDIYESLRML